MGNSESRKTKVVPQPKVPVESAAAREEAEKKEKRRFHIANEILETEKSYVKGLQSLCQVYLEPLRAALATKPILKNEEIKNIFSIVEVLLKFHEVFAIELEEQIRKWGPACCVGDVFAKNNAFLKFYSTYVNGYNISMTTVSNCKLKNKEFAQFLENIERANPGQMNLCSYLITPIQRLPRYVLLLTDLLKHTPPTHRGYATLEKALFDIKNVADFVNVAKREADNAMEVIRVQDGLRGKKMKNLVEPHRKFVSEGSFTYHSAKDKKPEIVQYFLFNDSFVFAASKVVMKTLGSTKLKVKGMVLLAQMEVIDVADTNGVRNGLKLAPVDGVIAKSFMFSTSSPQEKQDFIKKFHELRSKSSLRKDISVVSPLNSPQVQKPPSPAQIESPKQNRISVNGLVHTESEASSPREEDSLLGNKKRKKRRCC